MAKREINTNTVKYSQGATYISVTKEVWRLVASRANKQ